MGVIRALRLALFGAPAPRCSARVYSPRQYLESRAAGRTTVRLEQAGD